MKRSFLFIVILFFSITMIGQNYSIQKNNTDDLVAEYAEEIIKSNLADNIRQYEFTLTQNENEFTISYVIMPDNIQGEKHTDNVWNELETMLQQVLADIQKKITQQAKHDTFESMSHDNSPSTSSEQQAVMPSQNISTIDYTNPYIKQAIESQIVKEYTIDDVRAGKANVGCHLIFPDGSHSVIFYLDNQNHGLAVSLDKYSAKWENVNKSRDCHDLIKLPNEDGSKTCTYGLGAYYTGNIIVELGKFNAPAAAWCCQHGKDWYLPSAGELWYLLAVANNQANIQGQISKALERVGGQPLIYGWYWSSTENDKDEAINVSSLGSLSSEDKIKMLNVRAIRAF